MADNLLKQYEFPVNQIVCRVTTDRAAVAVTGKNSFVGGKTNLKKFTVKFNFFLVQNNMNPRVTRY
jgi:hypothetical protein